MIYLDHAATSFPKPAGMIREMEDCMKYYCGNPGRSGHRMSLIMGEKIYFTRKQIAKLIGANDPSKIIFTKNTTESLNLALRGILRKGDHVITTSMEHNSVLRPLHVLEKEDITHTIVFGDRQGRVALKDVKAAVTPQTKLIVMTGASNVTGTILPVDAVCKWAASKGIFTLIDGAQYVGSLPLNVEKIGMTMLAFPGHKGLLGPQGTGGLYVSPSLGDNVEPLLFGGTGTESKSVSQLLDFPEGFEAGTVNGPGIIGLGYSAAVIEKLGTAVIRFHEQELISHLESYLRNMDFVTCYGPEPIEKTGISLFNIRGLSSEEVTDRLNREFGIAVRGGFHCAAYAHDTIGTGEGGAVRLSVGLFNTRKEIKTVAEAIYRIGKSV